MKKAHITIAIGVMSLLLFTAPPVAAAGYTCSVNGKTITHLSPDFFGMFTPFAHVPGFWPNQPDRKLEFFQKIKAAGISSVRVYAPWRLVEPSKGEYHWDKFDPFFQAVEQAGLKALPFLIGIPDWAKPTTGPLAGKMMIDPSHNADWTHFVQESVKRYSSTIGSVAKVASDWELWNEPYNEKMFQGTPQDMVVISNLAYDTIKAADPQARVWSPSAAGGGVLSNLFLGTSFKVSTAFFTELVKNGKFDVLTIHLYNNIDTTFQLTQPIKQYLKKHGNALTANAKLAVTETNLPFPAKGCAVVNSLSEQAMANMITDRYACLSQAGADFVYYFMARDLANQTCEDGSTTVKVGILNSDLTPRASYYALKDMITTLTGQSTPTPTPSTNPADLNSDGKVDIFDYNLLVADFGKTGAPGWIKADINKNGKVDIFDYNILVGNFGK